MHPAHKDALSSAVTVQVKAAGHLKKESEEQQMAAEKRSQQAQEAAAWGSFGSLQFEVDGGKKWVQWVQRCASFSRAKLHVQVWVLKYVAHSCTAGF